MKYIANFPLSRRLANAAPGLAWFRPGWATGLVLALFAASRPSCAGGAVQRSNRGGVGGQRAGPCRHDG